VREISAVVARIQLAAEMRSPVFIAANRRKHRGGALGERHIGRRPKIGNRQIVARYAANELWREPDREP